MAWATRLRDRVWRRLASILTRLLLINLIVMAVPLAGMWFARLYERQLLHGHEQDMIHQTQVLREALLAQDGLELRGRDAMLARISEHTGLRLRLVGPTGRVLSDSGGPASQVGERAEIQAALAGRYGSITRFSPERQRLNLFAALPVTRDGAALGVVYASRSTAEVTRALLHLRRHLERIFWISVGITVVMTLFLAATISRPLGRLASRAEKIAEGNTVLSLEGQGSSEIGELARAFERMRVRLKERVDANAAMAADISHEFKSPLTSIRGAAELLLDGAADDPQVRTRFLRNIADDSERMSRLVGRLLELSRLEADASPAEVVDLVALVREELQGRDAVVLEAPPSPMPVLGRVRQLRSAVSNLLDNAEQHAEVGSLVRVHLSRTKGAYHFEVSNRGTPISPPNLQRMWQRFFTTRSEIGGSGLGLAIVRSAVKAHGGRVHASSGQEGTRIGFCLPSGGNVARGVSWSATIPAMHATLAACFALALISGCNRRAPQPSVLSCVESTPPGSPAERLSWMLGTWTTEGTEGSVTNEEWCPGDGGALIGYNETRKGGRVVHAEHMRIVADGDAMVYIASPSSQSETEFRGSPRCGSDEDGDCSRSCEARFTNPQHDFPKHITYGRCTDSESLIATIGGDDDQRRASWEFRRTGR